MTEQCISPLRRRMIEDMTVRNLAADMQRNYIRAGANLARFLLRSPAINSIVSALRFFFP